MMPTLAPTRLNASLSTSLIALAIACHVNPAQLALIGFDFGTCDNQAYASHIPKTLDSNRSVHTDLIQGVAWHRSATLMNQHLAFQATLQTIACPIYIFEGGQEPINPQQTLRTFGHDHKPPLHLQPADQTIPWHRHRRALQDRLHTIQTDLITHQSQLQTQSDQTPTYRAMSHRIHALLDHHQGLRDTLYLLDPKRYDRLQTARHNHHRNPTYEMATHYHNQFFTFYLHGIGLLLNKL